MREKAVVLEVVIAGDGDDDVVERLLKFYKEHQEKQQAKRK
jgi:hypothetical protein